MRTRICLFICNLLAALNSYSQTWNKNFLPNWSNNFAYTVYTLDTVDGGLLAANTIYEDCYLVRFNNNGDTLWTETVPLDTFWSIHLVDVIRLSGGDYLVFKAARDMQNLGHDIVMKYTSNGTLISEFEIPSLSGPYTEQARLLAGDNNTYYVSYREDTSFMYFDQFNNLLHDGSINSYIKQYDVNNNEIWSYDFEYPYDSLLSYWSSSNQAILGSTMCLMNNSIIVAKHYDTLYPFTQAFGNSRLERIDANGNLMWSADLATLLNLSSTIGVQVSQAIVTSDSTIIVVAYKAEMLQLTQIDGFILLQFDANGNLMNQVNLTDWQYIYQLAELQNGDILCQVGELDVNTQIHTLGLTRYDHNLNFVSYAPEPFAIPLRDVEAIVPNQYGGAFLAYKGVGNNYIYAVNFDSLYNTYPAQVSGNIYLDANQDCQPTTGDHNIAYSPVKLTDGGNNEFYAFSNSNGVYNADVPLGSYAVTHPMTSLNKQPECPVGGYNFNFVSAGLYTGADFYDTYIPGLNNLAVEFYPGIFVPGFTCNAVLSVNNVGSVSANATLTITLDNSVQFNTATPTPASVSGNTLTFNIANLDPDSAQYISIAVDVSQTQQLGSTLTFNADVPLTNDIDLNNNSDALTSVVVGSFDPNDKAVNRPLISAPTDELIYKVRFQNTGTYYAKNVVVVDTISSLLDLSTFRLVSAAPMMPEVTWDMGNKLTFTFKDIYLPDSNTNEPASHGEFMYGIKPKTGVPLGDTVFNTAYIYFDFNPPVITNTTVNVMGWPTSVATVGKGVSAQLYPNPTNGRFNIVLPDNDQSYWDISVSNAVGQIVLHKTRKGSVLPIEVMAAPGIYFVRIINIASKEMAVKKLIIQ